MPTQLWASHEFALTSIYECKPDMNRVTFVLTIRFIPLSVSKARSINDFKEAARPFGCRIGEPRRSLECDRDRNVEQDDDDDEDENENENDL